MDSTHLSTCTWYFLESQCQIQAMPWSTFGFTQVSGGCQGLVAIIEKVPHGTQLEYLSTLIWALNHHQGYGWQIFWIKYSTLPWPAPSIQCGPPSTIFLTTAGHIKGGRAIETYRNQTWLHVTRNHLLDYGHIGSGHPQTEDPTLSGCQSMTVNPPRQVAH